MEQNFVYPLTYGSENIGYFHIHKKRENGSWGVTFDIDVESLQEDTIFQRRTGNISGKPEVIAVKEVAEKVFNEHKDVVALYLVVPSHRPDLIRIFEAAKFKRTGTITTNQGLQVRLERVRENV